MKVAGPTSEVVDRTDQLHSADAAVMSEDTAVLAADDTAVTDEDVDVERRVTILSSSLLDSTKHSFRMLSDHLTLDLEADEVADVGADC